MSEPTVMLLIGAAGTGKTTLLEQFINQHPGSFQILTADNPYDTLQVTQADWDAHAGIAIEEIFQWDKTTLPMVIADMEREAISQGKKLILVTQNLDDISSLGIKLSSNPVIVTLVGRHGQLFGCQEDLSLSYDGKKLHFKATE